MAYITNQYRGRVYQIETKSPEASPKPIYLKPLTLVSEEVLGAIQTRSRNVKLDFPVWGQRRQLHRARHA